VEGKPKAARIMLARSAIAVRPEHEYYGLAFEPDDPNTEMQFYLPVAH
jgi:hypothetical protein